jgi:NAD(P)H dehydrogenase (quinone)
MTVAITGATGEVGRRVSALIEAPRLIVRDRSRAPEGYEARVASDYGALDEMREALAGVDTVFLIPAGESADRVQRHTTAVEAAVAAGVRRLVYLSFFNAAPDATFTLARDHWHTEQHIRTTDLEWTFLRMNLYMDFIPGMVGTDGAIRGPAGDGRASAILRDDVAAAAAAVLNSAADEHTGRTYDLTGPSAFSLAEAASLLDASFVDETDEEAYASRAGYGAPDWEVRGWVTSYQAIRDGSLSAVAGDFVELTGRSAVSLSEYLTP